MNDKMMNHLRHQPASESMYLRSAVNLAFVLSVYYREGVYRLYCDTPPGSDEEVLPSLIWSSHIAQFHIQSIVTMYIHIKWCESFEVEMWLQAQRRSSENNKSPLTLKQWRCAEKIIHLQRSEDAAPAAQILCERAQAELSSGWGWTGLTVVEGRSDVHRAGHSSQLEPQVKVTRLFLFILPNRPNTTLACSNCKLVMAAV